MRSRSNNCGSHGIGPAASEEKKNGVTRSTSGSCGRAITAAIRMQYDKERYSPNGYTRSKTTRGDVANNCITSVLPTRPFNSRNTTTGIGSASVPIRRFCTRRAADALIVAAGVRHSRDYARTDSLSRSPDCPRAGKFTRPTRRPPNVLLAEPAYQTVHIEVLAGVDN